MNWKYQHKLEAAAMYALMLSWVVLLFYLWNEDPLPFDWRVANAFLFIGLMLK